MSETPQDAAIRELQEQYGEDSEVISVEEGMIFRTEGQELLVREDGAVSELQTSLDLGGVTVEQDTSAPLQAEAQQEGAPSGEVAPPPAPTSDVATVNLEPAMVQALTDADERQIIAEIEGRAIGSMVYSFRQGGSTVTGLSWKGVQEAARQMNTRRMGQIKIDSQPPRFENLTVNVATGASTDEGQPILEQRAAVQATVYAVDEVYGSGRWGTATQTFEQRLNKKDKAGHWIWQPDPHAVAKALSKAQRNAMEGMLPLELVEELKAAYIGKGRVEYIAAPAVDAAAMPAPLQDAKAALLGDEIRGLYAEFKRIHPKGMEALPPAEFHRYFTASQHDHTRLEEFKAFMEQRVAEAKEVAAQQKG